MSNELVKQSFDLAAPQEAMKVAAELQRFVTEKKLTANIKGKNYPLVEAWQFAGSQLGLYPLLIDTKDLSNPNECKYQATVEIRRIVGDQLVSRGVAVCSNKEASKKLFDEYAILSMAQTRAEGKAYRMLLSWLMKAAGFEATPAEEMDFAKLESDFGDAVGDDGRNFLQNLLETSSYEGKMKEKLSVRIANIMGEAEYQSAKDDLLKNQVGIDGASNPSQREINQKVRNSSKQPA